MDARREPRASSQWSRAARLAVGALGIVAAVTGCRPKRLPWEPPEKVATTPGPAKASPQTDEAVTRASAAPPPGAAPDARARASDEPEDAGSPSAAPPKGYELAKVLGVVRTRAPDPDPAATGNAVLLADAKGEFVVPIVVGGTEALTIRLRLKGEKYPRPLTHDLLSSMVKELGGKAVRVQVDEVRGHAFIGSVVLQQAARLIRLDARPSDAIAFALGSRVPIYASRAMLESAGIPREEIERDLGDPAEPVEPRGRSSHREPISL